MNDEQDAKPSLRARISPETYEQFRQKCFDLRISHNQAQLAAIELWLRAGSSEKVVEVVRDTLKELGYRDENRQWHNKLERVLNEGSERDKVGIQANLDWAVGALQPPGEGLKKRKTG
jgi:hypothetical protein